MMMKSLDEAVALVVANCGFDGMVQAETDRMSQSAEALLGLIESGGLSAYPQLREALGRVLLAACDGDCEVDRPTMVEFADSLQEAIVDEATEVVASGLLQSGLLH